MQKRKQHSLIPKVDSTKVHGLHNEIINQEIVDTLETNYMPYAMSVIVSRAIPEIDGFKPSHRKLLYTMYTMGLQTGNRTKSANIVGQTMGLNPHGDSAIYETMVRLSKGHDALLIPFVDSKGNFGKSYSRDLAYAASRYTEAKLTSICTEVFKDINKNTVDFIPNYDGTRMEPVLLPTTFPNILVSANTGIAVGMASQICGFNLNEVCQTTIDLIKNPNHDIMSTLLAPDFTTGGELLYNKDEINQIYTTGRGSFKVRAKWRYIKEEHLIEIYEIPYSTIVEAIIDKVADLIKSGKIREISDMRDETDLNGLMITIDLKRGVDPEKLMHKLFQMTPLMDSYSCNFNVLIKSQPKVLGVKEILEEWISWRKSCISRRILFDIPKKREQLHLMLGLQKILLDIDKAIKIIRETKKESEVVTNLMNSFDIDHIQAEYVADIKLRNINEEYILKRTKDVEKLQSEIIELEVIVNDTKKIENIIIKELKQVIKQYPSPRRTTIVKPETAEATTIAEPEIIDDYNVNIFLTHGGYFKKIPSQSLSSTSPHKYKDNDKMKTTISARNSDTVLFFTDKQQVYIARLNEFENMKMSSLGVFIASYLEFDADESIVEMVVPGDYKSNLLFFFENGKAAKIPLVTYITKSRRKKLTSAYSDTSPLHQLLVLPADKNILVQSTDGRSLIYNTSMMQLKLSRTAQGVQIINLKEGRKLKLVKLLEENDSLLNVNKLKVKNIPSTGILMR